MSNASFEPASLKRHCCGEFAASGLWVSLVGVCGGQPSVHIPYRRAAAARFYEPVDCLVDAGLKQMSLADSEIPIEEPGVTRAEPDCKLLSRDRVVHRPDKSLATCPGRPAHQQSYGRVRAPLRIPQSLFVSALSTKYFR